MGTQQLLFVILGIIIVSIGIAVGFTLFSAQSTASSRDAMINDLNHLGATAYKYRNTIRALGGGAGSYSDFTIPSSMKSNDDASFSVADVQVNSLTLIATSAVNPSNTIKVTVESDGKLDNWTYLGDFK
jgi:hypothetical protein